MTENKKPGPVGSGVAGKELADFDYWSKLSDEDKEWLAKFQREYYRNQFNLRNDLHRTKKDKRAAYARDDARRRDLWNNAERSSVPVETLPEENDDE